MSTTAIVNTILTIPTLVSILISFLILARCFFKATISKHAKLIVVLSTIIFAILSYIGELYFGQKSYTDIHSPAWTFEIIKDIVIWLAYILCVKDCNRVQTLIFYYLFYMVILAPIFITGNYSAEDLEVLNLASALVGVLFPITVSSIIYLITKLTPFNILPELITKIPKTVLCLLYSSITSVYLAAILPQEKELYTKAAVCAFVLSLIYFIYQFFKLIYQQNKIIQQLNTQRAYSEKILSNDDELRKFRHDYRNHMIVINSLFESGKTERAKEYINAISSDINPSLNKISTGNFITDTIINNKLTMISSSDVTIKFNGQIPSNGIDDKDLCTVFSNVLDNAVEAVLKLSSNKIINIECAVRNGMFIMNVSNPVDNNVKIRRDGTIKTTKLNKADHGIGMINIKQAVKKYSGLVAVTCENKMFNISIMMKPTT